MIKSFNDLKKRNCYLISKNSVVNSKEVFTKILTLTENSAVIEIYDDHGTEHIKLHKKDFNEFEITLVSKDKNPEYFL